MTRVAATFALATVLPAPMAHVGFDADRWLEGWAAQAVVGLDHRLLDDWHRVRELSGWSRPSAGRSSQPLTAAGGFPDSAQWRPLVADFFPAGRVDAALRVLACESGGDPAASNPFSGAAGLFQIMPGWSSGRWGNPFAPFDPFDPPTNVAFAAWLSKGGSDWSAWVCKP